MTEPNNKSSDFHQKTSGNSGSSITDLEGLINEIISKHQLNTGESGSGVVVTYPHLHEDFSPVSNDTLAAVEATLQQTDCPTKLEASLHNYDNKVAALFGDLKDTLENKNDLLKSKKIINTLVLMNSYITSYFNSLPFTELDPEEHVFKKWVSYEDNLPEANFTKLDVEKNEIIQELLGVITQIIEGEKNYKITELSILLENLKPIAISLYRIEIALNNMVVDKRAIMR